MILHTFPAVGDPDDLTCESFEHYAKLAVRVQKWLKGADDEDALADELARMLRK